MAAGLRHRLQQERAQLGGELRQLRAATSLRSAARVVDRFEQRVLRWIGHPGLPRIVVAGDAPAEKRDYFTFRRYARGLQLSDAMAVSGMCRRADNDPDVQSRTGPGFPSLFRRRRAPLVLGGVSCRADADWTAIPDADVRAACASCRALEQAIGTDGFSRYADDMSSDGINDSREYVKVALANVASRRLRRGNVGADHRGAHAEDRALREAMKESDRGAAGIPPAAVGVQRIDRRGPDGVRSRRRHPGVRDRQSGRERGGRGSAEQGPARPVAARATRPTRKRGDRCQVAEYARRAHAVRCAHPPRST